MEVVPSNDNLVIKPIGGGKLIYIPLVDEYVDCVDIEQKKVVIKKIPEYL